MPKPKKKNPPAKSGRKLTPQEREDERDYQKCVKSDHGPWHDFEDILEEGGMHELAASIRQRS